MTLLINILIVWSIGIIQYLQKNINLTIIEVENLLNLFSLH